MTTSHHLWLPLLRLIRDVFSSCPLDACPLVVQREVGLGQHGTVLLLFRRRALRLQPLVNPVAIDEEEVKSGQVGFMCLTHSPATHVSSDVEQVVGVEVHVVRPTSHGRLNGVGAFHTFTTHTNSKSTRKIRT
jgi:hypothetical protein